MPATAAARRKCRNEITYLKLIMPWVMIANGSLIKKQLVLRVSRIFTTADIVYHVALFFCSVGVVIGIL